MTDFEQHRQFLIGVAYRMLGSLTEAEDIVQDAFLRWSSADRSDVEHPRAYLAQIVSRLCLDRMKSAAARREEYPGTWLPEPLVSDASAAPATSLAEDLSMALLMTLERLSPLERAAFLLHDVFDMDYSAIAQTIERSEAAVRQLASRAREHVRDERPRFTTTPESQERLTNAFAMALASNDVDGIARLLAEEAVFYTDGGGKRHAALNPIYGRDKIVRFLLGVARKALPLERVERVQINGLPGFVVWTSEGPETLSLDVENDRIVALYGIRNPDKLRHLS
ncbi:MAG TPA: sigma-70 family RNA polymerase sigma factor [Kofleriaceae bacterium]|jgi:RNA polymerase sigma-70 factor (ECF subfamily)